MEKNIFEEITECINKIIEADDTQELSFYESYDLALKLHFNMMFREAFLVNTETPGHLQEIKSFLYHLEDVMTDIAEDLLNKK